MLHRSKGGFDEAFPESSDGRRQATQPTTGLAAGEEVRSADSRAPRRSHDAVHVPADAYAAARPVLRLRTTHLTVLNNLDSGAGSLRAAVSAADIDNLFP
jgi:hypothetical protein